MLDEMVEDLMNQAGFYEIETKKRNTLYFVVGDVHGRNEEMKVMIDEMKAYAESKRSDYRIIFLGDLIDRGPSLTEVVDLVVDDPNISSLTGNHEMCFIEERHGVREPRSKARNINHDKYDNLDPDQRVRLLDTFESFPFMKVLLSTEAVFVLTHAPLPRRVIDLFVKDWHTNISKLSAFDFCVNAGCELPIDIYSDRRFEFYHGHIQQHYVDIDQQLKKQDKHNVKVLNLDSGCVSGNYLLGFCINDKATFKISNRGNR